VLALDDERRWYRYHPLFRDALLARLQAVEPEQVRLLHRMAAAWYARQQRDAEAIAHALEAEDWPTAARLIERFMVPESWHNEYQLLRHWLTRLPADVLRTRPHLSLLLAQAIVFTTQSGPDTLSLVEDPLRTALQGYRETSDQTGEGFVLVARAVLLGLQGEFSAAFVLAREAFPLLPAEDRKWRGLCLSLLATEAVLRGQHERASTLLTRALTFHQVSGVLPATQFVRLLLADIALSRGELEHAHSWFQQVLASASEQPEHSGPQLTYEAGTRCAPFERLAWYGLAALSFERNDLAEAQRCLQEAKAVDQEALLHVLTPGLLLYVRLLQALGQAEVARTRLLELEASVSRSDVRRDVSLCQAWLALAQGDLAAAQHWAAELAEAGVPLALVRREEETLLHARLRIEEGKPESTLAGLAPLLQEAGDAGRLHRTLQILVLQARAQASCGNDVQARMTVLQAVVLASKAGYQRLFLEEGQFMKTILQHLLSDLQEPALASFVRHLLLAFGPALAPASAEEEPPVRREPLTVQEQRVLGLLAEGASNQEIARALVIGLSTAKKHVSNLLNKLGAQNRTQAIVRARADGLL
jgi:LuxR family maltose regulon positive regulatory protein